MGFNDVMEELKHIKNRCDNEGRYSECEALDIAMQVLEEKEQQKVTRGGFFVPLAEVQLMLRNIQRQMGQLEI